MSFFVLARSSCKNYLKMSIFPKFFRHQKFLAADIHMSKTSDASLTLAPMHVRVKERRYPFCIVWTPIPVIT